MVLTVVDKSCAGMLCCIDASKLIWLQSMVHDQQVHDQQAHDSCWPDVGHAVGAQIEEAEVSESANKKKAKDKMAVAAGLLSEVGWWYTTGSKHSWLVHGFWFNHSLRCCNYVATHLMRPCLPCNVPHTVLLTDGSR